ncbi:ferredoxin [Amycolatopsis sp. NPDC059021]|uniref:ferredoxin n=1 Tax=Amycolatopsis sp. NPDC059021 TaxID=3346704 RepID=UPI00366BB62D
MRVHADPVACIGSGVCALRVPEVFDQDEDDGTVVLLRAEPGPGETDAVLEAIESCPARALRADR